MKSSTLKKQPSSSDKCKADYILAHWLEVITTLNGYYYQLVTCTNQWVIEQGLRPGNTTYIGQCPMSQLVKLIGTMQRELTTLTQDMDQVARLKPSTTKQICSELVSHTLRLKRLNDQAQTRLYLIEQSAS